MDLLSDSLKAEVLLTVSNAFRFLVGLDKIKAVSGKKAGHFVMLEPIGDKAETYIETLSFFMGWLLDLVSEGAGVDGLVNSARRNGQSLTYYQNLVSSWQARGNGVHTGGAVRLHNRVIFSFSSSCTAEDGRQAELNNEAVVLCAARSLAMVGIEEVKTISEISHNHCFEELWVASGP